MLEEKTFSMTREEACNAAHGNLVSLIVVTIQFMQAHDLEVNAFWHFVGRRYATGWTDVEEGDIDEVAVRITRNMISCGAELQSISHDTQQAQLVYTGWPPEWVVDFLGGSIQESAQMCEVFRPITASLGLDYAWQLENGVITMTIERPS